MYVKNARESRQAENRQRVRRRPRARHARGAPSTVPLRAHATHGPRVPGRARVRGGAISGKTRGSKRTREKFFGGGARSPPSRARAEAVAAGALPAQGTRFARHAVEIIGAIFARRALARDGRAGGVQARDEGFETGRTRRHRRVETRRRDGRSRVEVVAFARHAGAVRRAEPPAKRDVAEYHDAADGDVGERADQLQRVRVSVESGVSSSPRASSSAARSAHVAPSSVAATRP